MHSLAPPIGRTALLLDDQYWLPTSSDRIVISSRRKGLDRRLLSVVSAPTNEDADLAAHRSRANACCAEKVHLSPSTRAHRQHGADP